MIHVFLLYSYAAVINKKILSEEPASGLDVRCHAVTES